MSSFADNPVVSRTSTSTGLLPPIAGCTFAFTISSAVHIKRAAPVPNPQTVVATVYLDEKNPLRHPTRKLHLFTVTPSLSSQP